MTKINAPPASRESEMAMLWSLIIDSDIVENFFLEGQLEWFYHYPEIAEAIFSLALEAKAIDLMSVSQRLSSMWYLDKIWGNSELMEITESVASTYNWRTHSETLKKLYKQRELIKIANKLLSNINENNYETLSENTIENINSVLSEWASRSTDMEDNIKLLEDHINKNLETNNWLLWYSWWNEFLDKYTLWIQASKTYRIGSPSWVGKTNLIYDTITSLLEQWAKVLFISLENSVETTLIKLLSSVQEVNPNKINKWEVKADIDYLRTYKDKFFLTDQLFDIWEIKREILKIKPNVVILDYIWLVDIDRTDEKTKYDKYADIIKTFVQKNKHISLIDLSNLNKDDNEERIRQHRGFNGSAKLRNNTDVWIHLFYYAPFYKYKKMIYENWEPEAKKKFEGVQAITFLISKNRLWPDNVEEDFVINFDKGIRYKPIPEEIKEKYKSA